MKLSELIAKVGDDNVMIQNLDQCATKFHHSKGVTKITFGTHVPINADGTTKLGMVIWLDRETIKELMK